MLKYSQLHVYLRTVISNKNRITTPEKYAYEYERCQYICGGSPVTYILGPLCSAELKCRFQFNHSIHLYQPHNKNLRNWGVRGK